jgi:hypothetical protein
MAGCFCESGLLEYHGSCVTQDMCPGDVVFCRCACHRGISVRCMAGGDSPTVVPPGMVSVTYIANHIIFIMYSVY